MLHNKIGLTALLVLVFAANYVETAVEARVRHTTGPVSETAYLVANAVHRFERNLTFEYHDTTDRRAMYGYSVAYFFLFPLLGLGVACAVGFRNELAPYRVFCLAILIDYLVSLPFFLVFPVPERWAYPESGAMLLSDLWSSRLIESFRPYSGLDNCFPSFHVSLTAVMILVCYRFQVRLRTTVLALGTAIMVSTFLLGIHWIPDIIAGLLVGLLSVVVALRATDLGEHWQVA